MSNSWNKQPYFDDFDSSKNFTSVLFKPSKPVQVRELNQLQSIQHNQVAKFGDHMFKHGAKVDGASPNKQTIPYVTFNTLSEWDNVAVDLLKFANATKLVGVTSGCEAVFFHSEEADELNPPTVYVNYTKTGIDFIQSAFLHGEVVNVLDADGNIVYHAKVRCQDCPSIIDEFPSIPPTGFSTIWQIPFSTFYVNGFFIEVQPTTLVGERYSFDSLSYKIGLDIVEDVVTSDDDASLFDNALGYPNYSADGADRARTILVPSVRTLNSDDGETFVVLAKILNGTVQYLVTRTQYADLMDTLAERTYDESGNYTVSPFKVKFMDHLKKDEDDPYGMLTAEEGGDENLFVAIVSPGKAYVKGYLVEKIAETSISLEKARDTESIENYFCQIDNLAYLKVTLETDSSFLSSDTTKTSVFTNDIVEIWTGPIVAGNPTGTQIGTLKIYDVCLDPDDGTNLIYQVFVTDVNITDENFTYGDAKTLFSTNSSQFMANLVDDPITLVPTIYSASKRALIWDFGKVNIKSTYEVGTVDQKSLGFVKRVKMYGTLDGTGSYTFTAQSGENFYFSGYKQSICALSNSVNGPSTPILLSGSNFTFTPSTITLNLGVPNAGKIVMLVQNVNVSVAQEKKKTITERTVSNILLTVSDNAAFNGFTVPYSDLWKVQSIIKTTVLLPLVEVDVTDRFTYTTGMADHGYVPIEFMVEADTETNEWIADADKFKVTFTHFAHGPGDFFSVDSYSEMINDPAVDFGYSDIPRYTNSVGTVYQLRDCIDFRPLLLSGNEIDTVQPSQWSAISTDISYYLPRKDLIVVNKQGSIYQKKGQSDPWPLVPKADSNGDEMVLYEISMAPYVFDVQADVTSKFIDNRRYTMRDIGDIERRVDNLEYYTTLSLLETSAKNFAIKDSNGLDRFKNGFVVDNFVDFQAAGFGEVEFKAGIDPGNTSLVPRVTYVNMKLDLLDEEESTNWRRFGNVIMADFDEEIYAEQPYASKPISVNPYFIFNKIGNMVLTPPSDIWQRYTLITPIIRTNTTFVSTTYVAGVVRVATPVLRAAVIARAATGLVGAVTGLIRPAYVAAVRAVVASRR